MAQETFRSFGLLEVTRERPCSSPRWTLALWPWRPVVCSRGALTSWWVPVSLARWSAVSVQCCCQRQRKWKLSAAVACRKGMSTLSQQESVARDAADRVSDALVEAGLLVRPVTCSPRRGDFSLGVRSVEASCWSDALALAPSCCTAACRIKGWASEKSDPLVGHFTFRAQVRRELRATSSTAHASSQRGGRQRRGLRVPVIRELRVAASLIFLAHRDLSAPWCSEVSLFDASPWSGAVVAASIPVAIVKETGRYNSLAERTHIRSAQRSAHQLSSSQSSPPIPLPPSSLSLCSRNSGFGAKRCLSQPPLSRLDDSKYLPLQHATCGSGGSVRQCSTCYNALRTKSSLPSPT